MHETNTELRMDSDNSDPVRLAISQPSGIGGGAAVAVEWVTPLVAGGVWRRTGGK